MIFRIFGIFLEFLEFPVFGIFYKFSDFQDFSFLFLVFTDFSRCYSFPLKMFHKMGKGAEGRSNGRKIKMVLRKNVSEKMFRKSFFSFSR